MRNAVLWAVLIVVLVTANVLIVTKERVLSKGEVMLLTLVPRDPRALLQGDYMTLDYQLARRAAKQVDEASKDGYIVIVLDEYQVAQFRRIHHTDQPLATDERLLRFRKRGPFVRLASDAFFFQEGHGGVYQSARYGELRVDATGEAVLVGLRDREFARLTAVERQDVNEPRAR